MARFIFDVSLSIRDGMAVWPGDPEVAIRPLGHDRDIAPRVSAVSLGSHSGTHIDAPAHVCNGGATVDILALERLLGPAWVAHLTKPGAITAGDLAGAQIPSGTSRLLIRTSNSDGPRDPMTFDRTFSGLTPQAAKWLLEQGIELVGIDGPSIEPYDSPGEPVHRILLPAGVIVIEGLDLAEVLPGAYELICLPLKLAGCDGAPVRAILTRDR